MDLTPQDMLALLRRTTDEQGWLEPLLDDPDSAALLLATCEIMGRLGSAALHDRDALTIGGASGGQHGTATITLTRIGGGSFGTVPKGYLFVDDRGVRARAQTDVPVGLGILQVFVPVETERQSELVNTEDDAVFTIVAESGAIIGTPSISNLIAAPGNVANGANTLAVTNATQIIGGAVDWLSVHGSERGLLRQPGELEGDYRSRIRNIVDQVTPLALASIVQAVVQRGGLPDLHILEPFDDLASAAIKLPRGLDHFDPIATDGHRYMDDPFDEMVSRRTATAYFRIAAQDYVLDTAAGAMFLDDGYFDDPSRGYPDAWVTMPSVAIAAFTSLLQHVQQAKGVGVNFDVYARDPDRVDGVGASSSGSLTTAWTLTPPPGAAWMVTYAIAGRDSPVPVAGASYELTFTLRDGSTIVVADAHADTRRIPQVVGKIVTQIVGKVLSDGTHAVNLVGSFWVHSILGLP